MYGIKFETQSTLYMRMAFNRKNKKAEKNSPLIRAAFHLMMMMTGHLAALTAKRSCGLEMTSDLQQRWGLRRCFPKCHWRTLRFFDALWHLGFYCVCLNRNSSWCWKKKWKKNFNMFYWCNFITFTSSIMSRIFLLLELTFSLP